MAVNILDTGKTAEFTIEVDYKDGGKLVTTGNTSQVEVIGDWTGVTAVNLEGVAGFKQEVVAGEKVEEVVAKVEEPVAPVKPRVILPVGKNPYIDANHAYSGASFNLSGNQEYEIENAVGDETVGLSLEDEYGNSVNVYVNEEELLLMAIRLLSTTPGGVRTSNGSNGFTTLGESSKDERAIGSAIFQLHSIVERRKHAKAMAEYEVKLAEFKKSEESEDEANALVELALRGCKAEFPTQYASTTRDGGASAVMQGWSHTYPKHLRRVQETLRNLGITAVHHLADVVAREKTEASKAEEAGEESKALRALAFADFRKAYPIRKEDDTYIDGVWGVNVRAREVKISKALEDLGLTARDYADNQDVAY